MKKDTQHSSQNDIIKKCVVCDKDYNCSYRSRNTSKYCSNKCRSIAHRQRKMETIESFVVCPICKLKFKEINNSHIWSHDMSISEWKDTFPEFDNLSSDTRKKKATLTNLTVKQSKSLKEGHTLKGFIKKHGEKKGKEKFNKYKEKKSYIGSKQYYLDKYGEENGLEKYKNIYKNKGLTLEKYINKYGEIEGKIKFKEKKEFMAYTKTLNYFLEKYGTENGLEKWLLKNKKMSDSSRCIDIDDIDEYTKYCIDVDKETRLSLQYNNLDKIELRGKDYHLDHKISKCYGFNNNIDVKIISNIHNLEIITASDNLSKQRHCSQSLDELIKKISN